MTEKTEKENMPERYFQHDLNPTGDFKLTALILKHDYYGYGVYWRIIELLHQNNNILEEKMLPQISKYYGMKEEILLSILNDFELFDFEDGIYSSKRVAKNIEEISKRKRAKQEAAKRRWKKEEEIKKLVEYYKAEYKKQFDEEPTLSNPEIKTICELDRNNEDFKEKLPKVFKRLSQIKFTGEAKGYNPLSSWLLNKNHYSQVANGEFGNAEIEQIKKSIETYKPPEKVHNTPEEEEQIRQSMNDLKKRLGIKDNQ